MRMEELCLTGRWEGEGRGTELGAYPRPGRPRAGGPLSAVRGVVAGPVAWACRETGEGKPDGPAGLEVEAFVVRKSGVRREGLRCLRLDEHLAPAFGELLTWQSGAEGGTEGDSFLVHLHDLFLGPQWNSWARFRECSRPAWGEAHCAGQNGPDVVPVRPGCATRADIGG